MTRPHHIPPSLGDCDFAALHKQPEKFADVIAYYNLIRDYVKHEDGLINSRLTWSLTVHGFLLTSFGLMFSKSTDLFAEFTRASTVTNPGVHGLEIAFLCVAQVLVAVLRCFVATSSLGSIGAAHLAIQHINCIAHASSILDTAPGERFLTKEVNAGYTEAFPDFIEDIAEDTHVAIGDLRSAHEIVTVTETPSGGSFKAHFRCDHPSGSKVRPLGWGLLPKVIGGGNRDPHFRPGHAYYFLLPKLALGLWIFLILLSGMLGAVAAVPSWRDELLSHGKQQGPSIQQPRGYSLHW